MQEKPKYDLIGDYPYEEVDEKFAAQFLARILEPRDIKAAGVRLENSMCPYGFNLKANQFDVALAVRDVLRLPNFFDDEPSRTLSRKIIADIVKESADSNNGKVDGEKVIRLFLKYRDQRRY